MAQTRPVALVTGATSGIGELAAAALAEAGFQVVGTGRDTSKTKARKGITFIDLDVTSDQSVTDIVAQVISHFGRIDVLVNNAGMGSAGATEENSLDQDRRVFEVNVFGVLRMTKAVLPHMRAQGSGRIVNISSIFGLIPAPFMASYGAAKHAIEGYSESVDHEVREHGIRVIIVEPAGTRTKFDDNSAHPDIPLAAYSASRQTVAEVVATAVNEGDDPNVVAAAIVAAATDAKPKLRYPASPNARRLAMLRRLVPAGAFDKQIRKFNKLPVKTSVQPLQSESSIR
jgi:short-subunit dehydrogenase